MNEKSIQARNDLKKSLLSEIKQNEHKISMAVSKAYLLQEKNDHIKEQIRKLDTEIEKFSATN
jgi:peptidoglycan hydrolase CwlO-like protein